jgi:hypothetical protein
MARYTGWKTVVDGAEKRHRSENKTYEWLCEWAAGQPDGAKVSVYVQEQHSDRWCPYEALSVDGGQLTDA